jgi:hypothetical protein
VSDLLLQRVPGRPTEFEVYTVDEHCIGRIALVSATPSGMPWMWMIDSSVREGGGQQSHGFEPTREAAMQAFAKAWESERGA